MIYHVSRVLRLRDNDGEWVTAGDTVHFSYGMPPIGVDAKIIERGGTLIGLCPGHNPPEFKLRSLRRYVGSWYKKYPAGGSEEGGSMKPYFMTHVAAIFVQQERNYE